MSKTSDRLREEFKKGDKIAISNNPSAGSKCLKYLQEIGLNLKSNIKESTKSFGNKNYILFLRKMILS